jgi:hypothetical protein
MSKGLQEVSGSSNETESVLEPCPIDEYEDLLERIFGVYLDATEGFRYIAESSHIFFDPNAKPKIRNEKGESPSGYVIYALGSHDTKNYMELSARTGVEVILANREDGANWTFIGSMAIVAAYQLWEDHYRQRIARHVGCEKLNIPIFGDLRRLRRCIIHNRGRWTDDVGKLECFELEDAEGSQELVLTKKIIVALWWQMRLALRDLRDIEPSPAAQQS